MDYHGKTYYWHNAQYCGKYITYTRSLAVRCCQVVTYHFVDSVDRLAQNYWE